MTMQISASLVKDLREKTGAGMMDCKTALTHTSGDMEAAIDWLRTKGLSKAAKKADRVAAEGLVTVKTKGNKGVIIEVNSETDFVSRNEDFQTLVGTIAAVALERKVSDIASLQAAPYPHTSSDVTAAISNAIATIGENMTLRRFACLEVPKGVVAPYVHGAVKDGLGRIGVLVALESEGEEAALFSLARLIALHVAAANPLAVASEALDPSLIERERAILREKNAGKPEAVLEKIIDSGLKTYYKEICLLDQISIHADHQGKSIAQVLKEVEKNVGAPIVLSGFIRYALGEGVEKQTSDFAAEVAATVGAL